MQSSVIRIAIRRSYAVVYEFLAEPLNFVRWAALPDSEMVPLDGGDWQVELPVGRMAIRFAPRNNFGVLDYQVFPLGGDGGPVTPVRLIPNEDGCELLLVWFQRPGRSEEAYKSDTEWVASDLHRLKALLEVG